MSNENKKIVDIYDSMEGQLKDDARSIKFIKNLGTKLIEKLRLINIEIDIINPNKKLWNDLCKDDKNKLLALHQLKDQYKAHLDIIMIVLNKTDNLIHKSVIQRYKEKGLEDKFFINIEEK